MDDPEGEDQPFGENNIYDVAVVGSGMIETMLAAALSRVGCKVVQIDDEKLYGDDYSNHTFLTLQDHLRTQRLFEWSPSIQEHRANRIPLFGSTTLTDIEKVGPVLDFQNEADIAPSRLDRLRHRSGSGSSSSYTLSSLARDGKVSPSNTAPNSRRSSIANGSGISVSSEPRRTLSANSLFRASLPPKVGRSPSSSAVTLLKHRTGTSDSPDPNDITRWLALLEGRNAQRYSIDLMPKLIWSCDPFTDKMQDTIARYLSFNCFSKLVLYSKGRIRPVPCTRAEIFADKQLSLKEKNMLYKLLRTCTEHNTADQRSGTRFIEQMRERNPHLKIDTFGQLLNSFQLPTHVVESIKHSIAMCSSDIPAIDGIECIKRFLDRCYLRNCTLPFLWPQYGIGDLVQSFARMAAVYGTVQLLGKEVEALLLSPVQQLSPLSAMSEADLMLENLSFNNDEAFEQHRPVHCEALLTKENKRIRARRFVLNARFLPKDIIKTACDSASVQQKVLSQAIIIGERSVMSSDFPGDFSMQSVYAAGGDNADATGDSVDAKSSTKSEDVQQILFGRWRTRSGLVVSLLELPSHTHCCPEGTRLLYLWCEQQQRGSSARSLLEPLVKNLYSSYSSDATFLTSSMSSVATSTTSLNSNDSGPHVDVDESTKARLIWGVFYNHTCWEVADDQLAVSMSLNSNSVLPDNVHVTSNARTSLGFADGEMAEAQRLFKKLTETLRSDTTSHLSQSSPTSEDTDPAHIIMDEFLQKVPDPEDIIIE